jgi:ABC-type transport system involved in multi-copper enzyme maturation permease subunit
MANLEDNGASVTLSNHSTFGYTFILLWLYLFIMINLSCLFSVRIVLTLVAMICNMSFLHMFNLVAQFVMIYILVLNWKLPKIPTPFKFNVAHICTTGLG